LLAYLLDQRRVWEPCAFPWEHPGLGALNADLRGQLEHGRLFSLALHGGALLYNLLLAEKRPSDDLITAYREELVDWAKEIDAETAQLRAWDRTAFWQLVARANPRVSSRTRAFVNEWLQLALPPASASEVVESQRARVMVKAREQALKGDQARLFNQRALERWNGDSGTGRIGFRWFRVQRIVLDILEGLGRGHANA
jgi:hypothetical protein